jgi:hypothetical protein
LLRFYVLHCVICRWRSDADRDSLVANSKDGGLTVGEKMNQNTIGGFDSMP